MTAFHSARDLGVQPPLTQRMAPSLGPGERHPLLPDVSLTSCWIISPRAPVPSADCHCAWLLNGLPLLTRALPLGLGSDSSLLRGAAAPSPLGPPASWLQGESDGHSGSRPRPGWTVRILLPSGGRKGHLLSVTLQVFQDHRAPAFPDNFPSPSTLRPLRSPVCKPSVYPAGLLRVLLP